MIEKSARKLTARQRDWLEKLTVCKNSSKSIKAFAASEGINLQDLYFRSIELTTRYGFSRFTIKTKRLI